MSLLTICQDAADEIGIAAPSAVAANYASPDARLLFRLAKKDGFLVAQRAFWNLLRFEHSFTTLADDSQGPDSLPADFDCFVGETLFNRTTKRALCGPVAPQEWAQYKAGLVVPSEPTWLMRGGEILLTRPQPGETIAYEYISTQWVRSKDGVAQATFLADTDTSIFPDDIHTQGVIWRWRKHKGMAFEDERLEYERMVVDRIMRDGGRPRLHTGAPARSGRGRATIPDYNTIPVA